MKILSKKILAGLVVGTLIFSGVGEVFAQPHQRQNDTEINAWAKETAEWSGASEKEILNAVKAGKNFNDIDIAAMLSKISGKSFTQVLSMKNDWSDVMKKLGITREKYEAAFKNLMVKDLAKESELDEATVQNLLENNYNPRDIRIAGRLAKASGKNVQEILDSKKINQRWRDVAKNLNVDENLTQNEEEDREHFPENPPER